MIERFMIMKITEAIKKDGSIVYRANVYLGVDVITGKKVKTSVTGRTKKEVKHNSVRLTNVTTTQARKIDNENSI